MKLTSSCAGILEQSMGARNRVAIGLSYTDPPGYIGLRNQFLGLKVKEYQICVSINGKFLSLYTNMAQFCSAIFLYIESKLFLQRKNLLSRWKSYFEPEKTILMTNVQDSVFQLFQRVENKVIS
jgi:hypothetical protein